MWSNTSACPVPSGFFNTLPSFSAAHHDVYGYSHESRGSHAGVRYIGLQSWDSVDSLESLSFYESLHDCLESIYFYAFRKCKLSCLERMQSIILL